MATAITFVVKVGGTIGTDCDYTSLNGADTYDIDLTAAATKVYGGSKTGAIANGAAITLYRSGSPVDKTGTCHRAAYGAAQILVRGIAGTATPQSGDQWRVDASNYFTITDGGDSAIVKLACSTTGAADTTRFSCGWTTNATNYVEVYAASGHEAGTQWSESKYRIEVTDDTCVTTGANCNGFRLTGIQMHAVHSAAGSHIFYPQSTGAFDIRVSKCLMIGNSNSFKNGINHTTGAAGSKLYVWNNIIYDHTGSGNAGIYCSDADTTIYLYNNTIVDCTRGISIGTVAAMYIFNNLIDCTDCLNGTFTDNDANCDYNACSDATTTGGTHDRSSCSFTYQDEDNNNFALGATDDDARDLGTDPGSYASGALDFEDDILGTTRPLNSVWDIGAHEYDAGGVTATGDVTLASIVIDGATLAPPYTLYCADTEVGAQTGSANPTNIDTLTPWFSALVHTLGVDITQVQIQVSAAGDSDFSEALSFDSGWLTLDTAKAEGERIESIQYGQA